MNALWTERELKIEWAYVYNERLAIMGIFGKPSVAAHQLAFHEADDAVRKIMLEFMAPKQTDLGL